MAAIFTAERVFNTAIRIERNGAAFYTRAAEYASDERMRKLLSQLAAAERAHAQTFAQLKRLLLDAPQSSKPAEPDAPVSHYLRNFAKGGIFNMTMDTAKALSEMASLKEILTFAIERERDSILFYTGIKELVPKKSNRASIDAIIYEEMAHLALLSLEFKKLH